MNQNLSLRDKKKKNIKGTDVNKISEAEFKDSIQLGNNNPSQPVEKVII